MNEWTSPAPVLIFTCGNPSRGDDALGPAMFEMLDAYKRDTGGLPDVELLTDYQLQIEHAVDLENRRCVLFVDAGIDCSEPFEIRRLQAARDDTFTTHAMSPEALLAVYQQVNGTAPPVSHLLAIRAYTFGLGVDISDAARCNLQLAFGYLTGGDREADLARACAKRVA